SFIIVIAACFISCTDKEIKVKTGLDMLIENNLNLLEGKNIGIITNQTGISTSGEHIVDILSGLPDINVKAVFAPEHGFRGNLSAGVRTDSSYIDENTGVRVWSIYGSTFKPTVQMLEDLDLLIYDIQDVGARFYTYISTMGLCMQAASENQIMFIVLDRPNPITGILMEGPIIEDQYFSFVGKYPIPVRYGLTPGELAVMIKGEQWLDGISELDLGVIQLDGWKRDIWYDETGLPWINPSPNIPSVISAILYPGMCLFEALNISEGRGTMHPFERIGAPWIKGIQLSETLNDLKLPGIYFKPVKYTPASLPGASTYPKYLEEEIQGVELVVTDRETMKPLDVSVSMISVLKSLYPENFQFRSNLERLIGTTNFRTMINNNIDPNDIIKSWKEGLDNFSVLREKYLLYK
ncbi:exo-beta-N-acetylmuramidase NamZ domain-containing protein, partial [candidate division KSB1 bacterium]